jgi:hypothetical protein
MPLPDICSREAKLSSKVGSGKRRRSLRSMRTTGPPVRMRVVSRITIGLRDQRNTLGEIFGLVERIMASQRSTVDLNVLRPSAIFRRPCSCRAFIAGKANPPVSLLKTERCSCIDARAIEMGNQTAELLWGKTNPDLLEVSYPNKTSLGRPPGG